MIKGIVFDLDGTLLYTLEDITDSINYILKKYGFPQRDINEVRLKVGSGSKRLVKDCIEKQLTEDELEKITSDYIKWYGDHCDIKTKPYEGILEVLKALKYNNIKVAVNSNKPDKISKELMKKHFPGIVFDEIIGSRIGIPNKPDPYSTNEIIYKLNLKKEETLYIGDSENDGLTAKNSGIEFIGCLWGFRDYETLKNYKANYIVSQPEEIIRIVSRRL